MKTKLFKAMGIVAVAIFMGYNVYLAQAETNEMSDIILENIEALSQGENNKNYDCLPPYDKYTCSYEGEGDGIIKIPGVKSYHLTK